MAIFSKIMATQNVLKVMTEKILRPEIGQCLKG